MRIAAAGVGILLAMSAVARAQDLQAVGRGHALYLVNCMSCHGADARGTSFTSATVKTAVPDLTRIADRDGRFEPVHVMMHVGGERSGGMDREMLRFHRAFQGRSTEASAAINVYCLMRYLEAIQGGVPMAAPVE